MIGNVVITPETAEKFGMRQAVVPPRGCAMENEQRGQADPLLQAEGQEGVPV
jgi:hypothetical protein